MESDGLLISAEGPVFKYVDKVEEKTNPSFSISGEFADENVDVMEKTKIEGEHTMVINIGIHPFPLEFVGIPRDSDKKDLSPSDIRRLYNAYEVSYEDSSPWEPYNFEEWEVTIGWGTKNIYECAKERASLVGASVNDVLEDWKCSPLFVDETLDLTKFNHDVDD